MKKIAFAFFTALFLTAMLSVAAAADKKSVETRPFKPGELLELDLEIGGNISITGWDKEEAEITLTKKGSNPDLVEVKILTQASGLRIASRSTVRRLPRNNTLDVEVKLPSRSSHEISSLGGKVSISGIAGSVSGKTMGGSVDMSSLDGSVSFVTMGGDITLENCVLEGSVKTMGGDLHFISVEGAIEGTTMGGNIDYDGVVSASPAGGPVRLQTMGGSITVKKTFGALEAETMGGDIRVDLSRAALDLSSMGGNITIGDTDSSVTAGTMGGNIAVKVMENGAGVKSEISLDSSGGKIHLQVPRGYPMNVDITLEITRRAFGNFQIKSDFPLDRTEEKGTAFDDLKKTLYARGTTGSGLHTVILGTTNGTITLDER